MLGCPLPKVLIYSGSKDKWVLLIFCFEPLIDCYKDVACLIPSVANTSRGDTGVITPDSLNKVLFTIYRVSSEMVFVLFVCLYTT